jgi:methionyl-tRNA synthetase
VEVDDLDGGPAYPVLTGDYSTDATWASRPIEPGVTVAPPTVLFAKLDPSVVDDELARMENPAEVARSAHDSDRD